MSLNPSAPIYDETSARSDETGTRESDAYVADAESAESSEPRVIGAQHKPRPILWSHATTSKRCCQ